jgi:putative ABC transport system permease protein
MDLRGCRRSLRLRRSAIRHRSAARGRRGISPSPGLARLRARLRRRRDHTPDYIEATGDRKTPTRARCGSSRDDPARVGRGARAARRLAGAGAGSFEILTSTALRERSLQIFDRAFAITYALEAIAVLIGLMGVSFAASSTALARRAEFGMLRHIGMLRRQVVGMLASEGVLHELARRPVWLDPRRALSLVLVYVVNRQSFNWSIDFAVPWQLGVLSVTLIAAAAVTAVWSGRAAMSQDAVRAVREDW